jgi:hypothetical protein
MIEFTVSSRSFTVVHRCSQIEVRMLKDEKVRRCKGCLRNKQLDHYRSWYIDICRRKVDENGEVFYSKVRELRHSWTCKDCEEGMERASAIVASTRPQRAERYSTDANALAVIDVRRRLQLERT